MDSRNPLVIVLIIALIAIGFHYIASPYENCKREVHSEFGPFHGWGGQKTQLFKAMETCRKELW
jgi:hypothetical protein|tara:strand:+ start:533 stop:724 length:192 start_codon:yes stop_codon:yes gene_type:complete